MPVHGGEERGNRVPPKEVWICTSSAASWCSYGKLALKKSPGLILICMDCFYDRLSDDNLYPGLAI